MESTASPRVGWETGTTKGVTSLGRGSGNRWATLLRVLRYSDLLLAGEDSQPRTSPIQCGSRAGWGFASAYMSYQAPRWTPAGLEVELWPPVCQPGSFPKGMPPVLGFAEVQLLTLTRWCCLACRPQSCPMVRQYFVTTSLKEFEITAEPTEENPPCKQDIKF